MVKEAQDGSAGIGEPMDAEMVGARLGAKLGGFHSGRVQGHALCYLSLVLVFFPYII